MEEWGGTDKLSLSSDRNNENYKNPSIIRHRTLQQRHQTIPTIPTTTTSVRMCMEDDNNHTINSNGNSNSSNSNNNSNKFVGLQGSESDLLHLSSTSSPPASGNNTTPMNYGMDKDNDNVIIGGTTGTNNNTDNYYPHPSHNGHGITHILEGGGIENGVDVLPNNDISVPNGSTDTLLLQKRPLLQHRNNNLYDAATIMEDNNTSSTVSSLLLPCQNNSSKTLTSTPTSSTSSTIVNTNTNSSTSRNNNELSVLGIDLSHKTRQTQFVTCAIGVLCFSLLYGFLQELISVQLCRRKLGLFQAFMQFFGYTYWSFLFRRCGDKQQQKQQQQQQQHQQQQQQQQLSLGSSSSSNNSKNHQYNLHRRTNNSFNNQNSNNNHKKVVPIRWYICLSLLRALDLAMTNMAMMYVNYPAKTLMKSARVVFTMLFGRIFSNRHYRNADYVVVSLMVTGLALFMHADSRTSAIFHPLGMVMLTISLLCDGAISNISEHIMKGYDVGQDEFIFRLYSLSTVAILIAAVYSGDLHKGFLFLSIPGKLSETNNSNNIIIDTDNDDGWSISLKFGTFILFGTTGFFGSSCSAAITKHFGALTMSITSTARKAMTLFLSFAIFGNACTAEHFCGVALFVTALVAKSFRAARQGSAAATGGGGSNGNNGSGGSNRGKFIGGTASSRRTRREQRHHYSNGVRQIDSGMENGGGRMSDINVV